jgi:hypothetical protein
MADNETRITIRSGHTSGQGKPRKASVWGNASWCGLAIEDQDERNVVVISGPATLRRIAHAILEHVGEEPPHAR